MSLMINIGQSGVSITDITDTGDSGDTTVSVKISSSDLAGILKVNTVIGR